MDAVEQAIREAKLREQLRYRRSENEFDSALELVRPEMQSSKQFVVNQDGRLMMVSTPFAELITKDAATANFKAPERMFAENWASLSLLCQFITEASSGKIDLANAQRFDAIKAGIKNQYSKSEEGRYATLVRTQRAENISTSSNYQSLEEKNRGLKLMPGR